MDALAAEARTAARLYLREGRAHRRRWERAHGALCAAGRQDVAELVWCEEMDARRMEERDEYQRTKGKGATMGFEFKKATKTQARLRLALIGPSGSGKTYTALLLANTLGKKVAVIDTEHGSASKYADLFGFDTLLLESFSPQTYVQAIAAAEAAGYDVLVIDSLSHAWMGKDGALEMKDAATAKSRSGNSFDAWRHVTPHHNALIEAMIRSRCHILATMRAKTEYVVEKDERGKSTPRKIGMAPVQRDGMEYEFDVVGDMDADNTFIVSKTRCPALAGKVIPKPGAALGKTLLDWLSDGAPVPAAPANGTPPAPPTAEATEPPAAAEGNCPRNGPELLVKVTQMDAEFSDGGFEPLGKFTSKVREQMDKAGIGARIEQCPPSQIGRAWAGVCKLYDSWSAAWAQQQRQQAARVPDARAG